MPSPGESKSSGETKTQTAATMLPNRLSIQPPPATAQSNEALYVGLNEEKMKELNVDEGDYVVVNGSQGLRVVARALPQSDCGLNDMFLCQESRTNIKKKTSDTATIYKVGMIEEKLGVGKQGGTNVVAALEVVLATSGKQNEDHFPNDELQRLVTSLLERDYNAVAQGRCLYQGALLQVPVPGAGRVMLFRVESIKNAWLGKKLSKYSVPKDGKFGCVNRSTVITVGPNIKDKKLIQGLKKTGYADIGGLKKELKKIRELVELPLRHPKLFTSIGVKPPKGVLMHGPPGTGKTMIARAIANETDCNFRIVNGPEIIGGAKGQSEENIRKLFAEAIEEAPSIIFIDEIDAIAPNRDKVGDEQMQRVVATLLTEMDGMKKNAHVMVIGATNRPNSLDPALRRSGRFDAEIQIGVPTREGRHEILQLMTKDKMLLAGPDDPGTVDLEEIARKTHGYVGADLSIMCTKAAVSCIREKTAESNIDIEADDLPKEFYDTLKVTMHHMDKAIKQTPASAMKEFVVEIPSVTFDDIGGLEDVKNELREMIEFPVTHPEYFEELGIQPPKGALLYGPPGCGKTLLAKAMANQCECNFISVKGPQLLSKWVGESESNVRNVFEKARQASPCILFFDELDSIARSRGTSTGGPGIGDSVVNQLLTEMDGMAKRNNVFVVGATNRPDGLDKAILRPGRLAQHVYVPIPDAAARHAILVACLRKANVSPKVDLDAIVTETDAFSGADLAGLCQSAAKISVRRRKEADLRGEDTSDWSIRAPDFEIAFRGARSSVPQADQDKYLKKKEMVGEGGITSGVDNFDTCTGLYKLTEEQALVKKERDAKEQDERNAKKERRAAQKAALKARGKAGLRSTSVKQQQQQGGEGKESKEGKESDEGKIGGDLGEGKESKK